MTDFGKLTDEQRKSWSADLWRDAREQSFLRSFAGSALHVTRWQRFKGRCWELLVRRPRDAWRVLRHGACLDSLDGVVIGSAMFDLLPDDVKSQLRGGYE